MGGGKKSGVGERKVKRGKGVGGWEREREVGVGGSGKGVRWGGEEEGCFVTDASNRTQMTSYKPQLMRNEAQFHGKPDLMTIYTKPLRNGLAQKRTGEF